MKDWDAYIDAATDETDKESRIAERNKWLDENAVVYGPSHVTSYYEAENGDHIESGTGRLLSTRESRAKEDIPEWRKFEIGRLEDVDGHIVPGPNALERDIAQYGKNIEKTGRAKKDVAKPDTPEHWELMAELMASGADSWVVDSPDNLPDWYWTLDKFAMDTGGVWGKIQIAKGHFVFYDGSGPRGRWSLDAEEEMNNEKKANEEKEMKIMPNDNRFTALEKALNWAAETHHGKAHTERWNRVAAAFGADNGYDPMDKREIRKWWNHHNCNKRWTVAMEASEQAEIVAKRDAEMDEYNSDLAMQGHYTADEWLERNNADPIICRIDGYDQLTIYDPGAGNGMPNWWLEGDGQPTQLWRYDPKTGALDFVSDLDESAPKAKPQPSAEAVESNRLPFGQVAALPEMVEAEAKAFYKAHAGDTITWVAQREPSTGPHVVVVLYHNSIPVAKKASRFQEFEHLPIWTRNQATQYFIGEMKRGTYSRRSLDGAWNTVKGYCHPDTYQPLAVCATDGQEAHAKAIEEAMRDNRWGDVIALAQEQLP